MSRPVLAVLVLPFALGAAVEDAAPPPLPTPADTAPTPADPTPATELTPATRGRRGAVREDASPFGASLTLSGGWDSNVLLLDDETVGEASDEGGPAFSADARGTWRAIDWPDARLNLTLAGQYDLYPDHDERDLGRFGALVSGMRAWNGWNPGFSLGGHRYLLDGEDAADVLTGSLAASRIARDWVAIPGVEVYAIDYVDLEEASGVLAAARYRHWFLLAPGNSRRRVEAGLRAGVYEADTDAWSYVTVRPELGLTWRLGDARPAKGTLDLGARTHYEWRDYEDGGVDDFGTEHLVNLAAEADWWTCRWSALGIFAEYTVRTSDREDRDYDRVQVGGRLTAAF